MNKNGITVSINNGTVVGEQRENGVMVFRGIPYGAPCDKDMRFLPPRPAQPWTGVLDCTRNGPIAPQMGGSISCGQGGLGEYFSAGKRELFCEGAEQQDENCLVLNVLTPGIKDKKPVLLYLHGGGFTGGSGALVLGADRLAMEQQLVLVGVNHRLGALGYLYLEHLDARFAGSGVAGLLDIVLALQWVRENIAAFGGNPEQVTILGESGGCMKVNMMLAMPQAVGLFRAAVAESGSCPTGSYTPEKAVAFTDKLLRYLGIDPAAADCVQQLQRVEAARIVEAQTAVSTGLTPCPVADGVYLQPTPADVFSVPETAEKIPLMVGSSADEWGVFTPAEKLQGISWDNIAVLLAERLHQPLQTVERTVAAFREADNKGDDAAHTFLHIISMNGLLGGGAFAQAMAWARQSKAPVYHYAVNYDTPNPMLPNTKCAWHTADLPLQMGIVLYPESEPISGVWRNAIGAFVRTGSPDTPSLAWPAFTQGEKSTMVFDEACGIRQDPWHTCREALDGVNLEME